MSKLLLFGGTTEARELLERGIPALCCVATNYGAELTAAVQSGNVYGVQFHPEKSGNVGLNILRAFCEVRA